MYFATDLRDYIMSITGVSMGTFHNHARRPDYPQGKTIKVKRNGVKYQSVYDDAGVQAVLNYWRRWWMNGSGSARRGPIPTALDGYASAAAPAPGADADAFGLEVAAIIERLEKAVAELRSFAELKV